MGSDGCNALIWNSTLIPKDLKTTNIDVYLHSTVRKKAKKFHKFCMISLTKKKLNQQPCCQIFISNMQFSLWALGGAVKVIQHILFAFDQKGHLTKFCVGLDKRTVSATMFE